MDQPTPSRRGFYFSASLWLIAAALLAWAICSLTLSPRQSPDTGELISNPTTEPAAASGSRHSDAAVRLYDVHDMIDRWSASQYATPWMPDMSTSNNQQQNPQGGGGIGVAHTPATQPSATDPIMDALVQLILDDIQSDQWITSGGATAAIQYCHHTLIIGGSPSLHRDIEKLLRNLRTADASTPIVAGE